MQQLTSKKGINLNLEALRGFAALFVVFNHLEALHTAFNAAYLPTATIVLAPNGRLFVLVFFVLSGYVIGLNHTKPMRGAEIKTYVRKRFVRIYPIYFTVLVVTLLVAQNPYSAGYIAINFLMLHVLLAPPFLENGPAWSLHYEMIYYALFIPISRFKLNLPLIIALSVVLALGGLGILSSYFLGLAFWLSGLYVANKLTQNKEGVNYGKLASGIFLLLALDQLLARPGIPQVVTQLMYQLPGGNYFKGLNHSSPLIHHPQDLVYLPIYTFLVILFSGREWRYERLCFILLNILLLTSILITGYKYLNGDTSHIKVYLLSVGYYICALVFWYVKWAWLEHFARKLMSIGAWFGAISFAIYIVHAPVIFLIGRVTFLPERPVVNYVLKLGLFFALVIPISWLLEKRLQPRIKNLISAPSNENIV